MTSENDLKQWQIWFGDLVKYVENGKGKILGRFYGVVTFVLIASTYFSVTGEVITLSEVAWYTVVLLIVLTIMGWGYSKFGFLEAEQSRLNEESPQIMETLRNTRRILKDLEK